jgi:hypothetical protein
MQDIVMDTKNYIRQFMAENFTRLKEIINAPDKNLKEQEEQLRLLARDKKRLYLPSTQSMVVNQRSAQGQSFILVSILFYSKNYCAVSRSIVHPDRKSI